MFHLTSIHFQDKSLTSPRQFTGACLDIGAQRTCIGLNQAKLYCKERGILYNPVPSKHLFQFGDGVFSSLGRIMIRIPTPDDSYLQFHADVVKANVPLLIGIDVLDKERLVADNVDNCLISRKHGWKLPVVRRKAHMFVTWDVKSILFTRAELQKAHLHFWHPSAHKFYMLLKRTHPTITTGDTLRILQQISEACATCAKYSQGPHRFRVSFPQGKCVFNHEIALDLVWLDSDPALHIVDTHTHFSAARFIEGKSTKDIWEVFLLCWTTAYVGYPDRIRVDQDSVFTSKEFRQLTRSAGIELQLSGVESHNALGVGERYHGPLRRIFLRIKEDVPALDKRVVLQLAVKAMNDTMGPEGLVPSLLVFGTLPRFPPNSTPLLSHVDRMEAMEVARTEMADITAQLRIQRALKSQVPPATKYKVDPGDSVYVHKENEKKRWWRGPYVVTKVFEKQVWVRRPDGEAQYSIDHILPVSKARDLDFIHRMHPSISQWKSSTDPAQIYLTEYLDIGDPREKDPKFTKAKLAEIAGLKENNVYRVVDKSQIPKHANVLGGRFVLCIKNIGTSDEIYKARYVVQGHKDKEKNRLVHPSTNLRQSSVRLLLSVAASFGFQVWSQDVTQAYLQSDENLRRRVYVKPAREFSLPEGHVLQLLKPLYGLSDAGDYWDATMTKHLRNDIGMQQTSLDISFFYKHEGDKLRGLSGMYVDDGIHAGDATFLEECNKTQTRFKSKPRDYHHFKFAGMHVNTVQNGIILQQTEYAKKVHLLPKHSTFRQYRSCRQKLQWLVHTRPDIACAVNKATQVTEAKFNSAAIAEVNRIIKHVHRYPERSLMMKRLNPDTTYLRVYTDGSFADNEDLTTQLGFLILMCDDEDNCNVIHFSSHKSKRVVRSVLGGEAYAFANGMDYGLALKGDLEKILRRKVALKIYTDSKSLFDVITKNTITTEKRLMVDVVSMREAYENFEIEDVAWIKSQYNPADALTKPKENKVLNMVLDQGVVRHPVEQWVIRNAYGIDHVCVMFVVNLCYVFCRMLSCLLTDAKL